LDLPGRKESSLLDSPQAASQSGPSPYTHSSSLPAVAKVLKEKYDIGSEFKRPNDVMVGSRKICGTFGGGFIHPVEA